MPDSWAYDPAKVYAEREAAKKKAEGKDKKDDKGKDGKEGKDGKKKPADSKPKDKPKDKPKEKPSK